jgi:hypothetical protein
VVCRPMRHSESEAPERTEQAWPKRAGNEQESKPCLRGPGRAATVAKHERHPMLPNV